MKATKLVSAIALAALSAIPLPGSAAEIPQAGQSVDASRVRYQKVRVDDGHTSSFGVDRGAS